MLSTKFQVIWCTSKDIMGIYLIFGKFGKKVWGRVINPLWCLKAPSPATKKWIFEFYTKFGFRNHLQTFWPRRLVKSELSLGLLPICFFYYLAKLIIFIRSSRIPCIFFLEGGFKGIYLRERNFTLSYVVSEI